MKQLIIYLALPLLFLVLLFKFFLWFIYSFEGNNKSIQNSTFLIGNYYLESSTNKIFNKRTAIIVIDKVDSLNWDEKYIVGYSSINKYFSINLENKVVNYFESRESIEDLINAKFVNNKLPSLRIK